MKKKLLLSLGILLLLMSLSFTAPAHILSLSSTNNNPPAPPVITGPLSGKIREPYTYYITVSDPDENDLLIKIEMNFGDGTTSCGGCDGRGPWESGETVDFEHTWTRSGNFSIRGRVSDEHGLWSDWSDPIPIVMPYSYAPLHQFFYWLFQWFPHAFPVLRHLMGY